jgi:hypothetical protein
MIKREEFTEQEHFILEAAMQLGFEVVDDDMTQFRCSDEAIVEFAARVAAAAIEQVMK